TPISGFLDVPTLAAAAGFTMDLGAGSGFFYDVAGITSDDSAFKVIRWAAQTLTFGMPDPGMPRIDLVCADPNVATSNSLLRNILTNPVPRTVTPTNVFKNQDPSSAITVVPGTPGATPSPPSTPADQVVLFEVWVPAGVGSSASFYV